MFNNPQIYADIRNGAFCLNNLRDRSWLTYDMLSSIYKSKAKWKPSHIRQIIQAFNFSVSDEVHFKVREIYVSII